MGEGTNENVSDFQVQTKPMSSVMPFTHKAIMILASLVTTVPPKCKLPPSHETLIALHATRIAYILSQISYKMHPIHSLSNTAINHMWLHNNITAQH